jgi:WD40 repeat protein
MTGDGRVALTASRDRTIRLWDLVRGAAVRVLLGPGSERIAEHLRGGALEFGEESGLHVGGVDTVAIAPNGQFAYSVVGDTVVASDLTGRKPLRRLSLDHNITAIAVTPDGLHAALGDESGRVHFLTLDAGEPVRRHGCAIGHES